MPKPEDEIKRLHLRNVDLLLAHAIETKRLQAEIDRLFAVTRELDDEIDQLRAEVGRLKNAQDKDNPT